MARLIHPSKPEPPTGLGGKSWLVRTIPYSNAAAKFWSGLLDEVAADFPPQAMVALSAPTGGWLTPEQLTPERVGHQDLDNLANEDLRQAYTDAVSTLDLIGPPPQTRLRIQLPDADLPLLTQSLEVLDAEILPFLLVWLLEWSNVPEVLWNEPSVHGRFLADDPSRHLRYRVAFRLANQHLREGLFQREVNVTFDRESLRAVSTQPLVS